MQEIINGVAVVMWVVGAFMLAIVSVLCGLGILAGFAMAAAWTFKEFTPFVGLPLVGLLGVGLMWLSKIVAPKLFG